MRALRCTSCVVLALGLCAASVARGEDNVGWLASIPMAQKIAAESGRLVLVHFWSPSCAPCMRLDTNVFSLPTVGRAIQRDFVPVKMNADYSPTTATQYGVTSLPTDVILTPAGQVVAKFNSPMDASQYVEQLCQCAQRARSGAPVANIAAAGPPNAAGPNNTVPWGAPPAGQGIPPAQGLVTPTAGTQPAANGFPATPSNTPLFAAGAAPAPSIPAGPPAVPAGVAGPSIPPAQTAQAPAGTNTSPYSNDRYADYLRQRGVAPQGAAPTQQAPGTPQMTANAPATQPPANAWGQQPPGANTPAAQPTAQAGFAARPPENVAAQVPAGNPPLALDGYCPVRLREEYKWALGDRRFGAIHRGRTYLFTSQAEQQKFLANPDLYSPVMSGNDPVLAIEQGMQVPGQRKLGVFYGDGPAARIVMFSSDESLKRFWENPERYAGQIRQAEAAGRGPVR